MLHNGYLLLSFSISVFAASDGHASRVRKSPVLKRKKQSQYSSQGTTNYRRRQSVCSAPLEGCGYGLFNEYSCECSCIPPYCFDDIFQSCVTVGSCPDAFEGCTLNVDCPYFPNVMTGLCESGPTIAQGIYTIFRTEEECCMKNYPDASSCIKTLLLPTAGPSLAPQVTATPQATEPQATEPQATEPQAIEPQAIEPNATETHATKPHMVAPPVGVFLTPIPISFYNSTSQLEFNSDRRGEMTEIIQDTLTAKSDDFNVTILQVDVVGEIFSDQDQTLPLELQITVMGTRVYPTKIHDAFLNTLQDEIYEIANALKGAWGPETYTSSVILSIGGVQTTSAPTIRPTSLGGAIAVPANQNYNGGEKKIPIWAVVLFLILFVMLCGGLLVCYRHHDKSMNRELTDHGSFFQGGMSSNAFSSKSTANRPPGSINITDSSCNQSCITEQTFPLPRLMNHSSNQYHQGSNQPRLMNQSSNKSRQSRMNQSFNSHRMDQSINEQNIRRERWMDQSSNQSRQSRRSQSFNSNMIDQSINGQNINREGMGDQGLNQSRQSRMSQSFNSVDHSVNGQNINRERRMDQSLNQSRQSQMRQSSNSIDQGINGKNINREGMLDQGLNQPRQMNRGDENIDRIQPMDPEEERLEEGYDGGKSSSFILNTHLSDDDDDDDSPDLGVEADESEDNVLGLLYYADASSADESGAKETRRSRRSGRTSRTSRSRYSSGKSTRHSSGKSGKSKSSRLHKPCRKNETIKPILEESEYDQQERRGSEGNAAGESDRWDAHVAPPIAGDEPGGPVAYVDADVPDESGFVPARHDSPRGGRSVASHGSTIRTEDNHRQAWSRRGTPASSHDSAGQCADFSNMPEAKF